MSVLMKALEKAAEDRGKAPADSQAAGSELSLEAMDARAGGSGGYPPAAGRSTTPGDRARSAAQINAATVLSARGTPGTNPVAWVQAHPLYAFGGLAGLFLLLYAAYVYVQIAHPGWLIRTPPPTNPPIAALTAPPATAPIPAARGSAESAPAPQAQADSAPLVPLPSVFGGAAGGTAPQSPGTPASGAAKDEAKDTKIVAPVVPPLRTTTPPQPAAPAPAAPERAVAPQNRVTVSRGDNAVPRVDPAVSEAYAALEAGRFDAAQRLYGQALKNDPANIDALLGLAAIAQKDNRTEDAQRYFMAILASDPRHALAQSGLIELMGRSEPQAAESRLKQLLAREPSAPLYFNLGNLYADQGLWAQAQQAYFQAHNLEPGNPDYAYNLAVGLEHLGQQKLALGFYRKAQQLASVRGAAHFDNARIQDRITQLSARFD